MTTREASAPSRVLLLRDPSDRLVAGVAAALAKRLGVEPLVARLGFVVLTAAGGVGLLVYGALWVLTREGSEAELAAAPRREVTTDRIIAVGLVLAGLLLALRTLGLWAGDTLVTALALAGTGTVVLWSQTGEAQRARLGEAAARIPGDPFEAVFSGRVSPLRILAGGLLVAVGMAALLAAGASVTALASVAVAIVVTVGGLSLILGPWMWRLARQLADERRQRIRSEERAEMAAHLHDSVLQTLALIQRADVPPEVVSLARAQERDLRSWLHGRLPTDQEGLSSALAEQAARVENHHDVRVEVVVVGDVSMDERVRALVAAAGEAMTNAALHSGAARISVYGEVEDDRITVYVADEGKGFDVNEIPAGRRGISESIRGRMQRHGGSAEVTSTPGEGTEVALELPRSRS